MRLDSITEKITLTCAGAHTTTPGDIVASWDVSDPAASPKFNSGSNVAVTAGTSSVDVIPVPLAGTARVSVEEISVTNNDTAPMTVTIFHTNTTGPVNRRVFGPCTLQVGEKIQFKAADGWKVFTVTGAVKVTAVQSTVEPGYIDGFQMVRVSPTQLDVTSGTCYIPSIGANVNSAATISKSGLALTNNTMYHVYFGLLAGVPDIELSTTAPASPYNGVARNKTGDPTRRYIGSFLTNGSGQVRNFLHTPTNGYIGIQENTNASPYLVLVGGVATVATTISCAGFAPPTCRAIVLLASNGSTNSTIALANPDITGALTTTNWTQIVPFVSTGNMQLGLTISLSSAQAFNYIYAVAPSPGGADIRATGYYYDR